MFWFYTLYSLRDQRLYKGVTQNIAKRLARHNSGGNKSTAHRKPFVLVYAEEFLTKTDALAAERFYKSLEGGARLKQKLVDLNIIDSDGKLLIQ